MCVLSVLVSACLRWLCQQVGQGSRRAAFPHAWLIGDGCREGDLDTDEMQIISIVGCLPFTISSTSSRMEPCSGCGLAGNSTTTSGSNDPTTMSPSTSGSSARPAPLLSSFSSALLRGSADLWTIVHPLFCGCSSGCSPRGGYELGLGAFR